MSRHNSPQPPRSCFDRGTRSLTNDTGFNAMRATAWHRHGVAVRRVGDIADDWLCQAANNEPVLRRGRRGGESHHGS